MLKPLVPLRQKFSDQLQAVKGGHADLLRICALDVAHALPNGVLTVGKHRVTQSLVKILLKEVVSPTGDVQNHEIQRKP